MQSVKRELEEKPDREKEEMMKAKIQLESQLKEAKKKTEGERIRDTEKVSNLIPSLILIL